MNLRCQIARLAVAGVALLGCTAALAQTVEVFAAGSLRGVVSDLARRAEAAYHIELKATFGGSGLLRERIERGETPDLFLSADLGSPRRLAAQGRTVAPVIAFAGNRMCVLARRSAAVTEENLIERMLAPGVRLKTSTPVADPAGDYAWAIFAKIEALRPGAGALLKEKAQALMRLTPTPAPNQSAAAALFESHQVDMSITYCSAVAALAQEVPDLASLVVPPRLDPHPVDGLAVLSLKPAALRVALLLLSEEGQALIAAQGLVPVADLGAGGR